MSLKAIKRIFFENKLYLCLIILLCGIIIAKIKTYGDPNLMSRPVSCNGQTLNYFTDSIKFHTKVNGYEVKMKQDGTNNFYTYLYAETGGGPGIDVSNVSGSAKSTGYGNYQFNEETNLYDFINYCHTKNAAYTEASCYLAAEREANSCNYTKLTSYANTKLTKQGTTFMDYFWTNMCTLLGDTFKEYQDSYFFEKYIYKGLSKTGMSVRKLLNAQNAEDDECGAKEYLTCMNSYMYALTPAASPLNFTVGKGDVVPFLYYKMNVDETNPKVLAKYAYVALIEGWCSFSTKNYWLAEYESLYGDYDTDSLDEDLDTLEQWYYECYDKYKADKGRKGNNLLGSDITVIIKSDYSISDQLEATDDYLTRMFNELGLERSYKENIARNHLMAEYMMQDSGLENTIKDYNVSIKFVTENLQRGTFEEKNSSSAVLSDYQTITLNHTLDRDGNSDNDTISDKTELGNIKWMDITAFIEKTYNDRKSKGESVKSTLEEQIEDICVKQGKHEDFGGNIVWGHVKYEGGKVYYRTYDYTSNPVLDDTDFDGLRDDIDIKKLDNKFTGTTGDIGNIEYYNDFRWFFTNNTKYNDELCTMSLIASNLARGNTINTNQVSGNITNYLASLGFTNIRTIGVNGYTYIGSKEINYYGVKKNIVAVVIGDGNLEQDYNVLLKNINDSITGATGTSSDKKIGTKLIYNEEQSIEDVANKIKTNAFTDLSSNTYWVTGYGIAGSLATEVAKALTEAGGEVYAYTFGAINTGVNNKGNYSNIKNIINEDDLIPKIANKKIYSKPGQIYSSSIKEDLMSEYRDIIGNKNYKGDFYLANYIEMLLEKCKDSMTVSKYQQLINEWSRQLAYFTSLSRDLLVDGETSELAVAINNMSEATKDAHSMKAYYVLSKSLNGFDLTDYDEEKEAKYSEIHYLKNGSDVEKKELNVTGLLESIQKVANWYINNVYTYQAGNYGRYRAKIDSPSKRVYNTQALINDFISKLTTYDDEGSYFTDVANRFLYIAGSPVLYKNKDTNKSYMYTKDNGLQEIDNSLYQAAIDGRSSLVQYNDGSTSKTYTLAIEDENKYQEEYKNRFKYFYDRASQTAKDNRKNSLKKKGVNESNYNDIYKKYTNNNAIAAIVSNTYESLNVDSLKSNEVFTATGRDTTEQNERGKYVCSEANSKSVGDDCSGFVSTVLYHFISSYYSDYAYTTMGSSTMINTTSYSALHEHGFKLYKSKPTNTEIEDLGIKKIEDLNNTGGLKAGDILVSPGNHVEFYLGKNNSFGWGNVQSSYNKTSKFEIKQKSNYYYCTDTYSSNKDDREYTAVYRWEGLDE